jgi:hypothetical protein
MAGAPTTATTHQRRWRFLRIPAWCRHRAAELGPAVVELVGLLLADGVLHRLRTAQGVLRLADRYSAARLDAACARAITVGDPAYRTVKGILVAGTEHDGAPPPALDVSSPPSAGFPTLFNRLLGCLHHCLQTRRHYNEQIAFPTTHTNPTNAAA